MESNHKAQATNHFDAVVVGGGFSGIYMLYRLRAMGLHSTVIEAGAGPGGTWYWNRYPGARCDVESLSYSYSFSEDLQQEWNWTARYATQPEILDYCNHVVDRFDLRRDMRFETRVVAAAFNENSLCWELHTDQGDHLYAKFCIMATGCLSTVRQPDLEGLNTFSGNWHHTGHWPHEGVDFTDRQVGVIGTGSSAIQSIPLIAEQAAHLTVFQRTANFTVPAWDAPLDADTVRERKANYALYREIARGTDSGDIYESSDKSALDVSPQEVQQELERRWQHGAFNFQAAFADLITDARANALAAEFARNKIRQRVNNPDVAELLCPQDHPLGTKRLCVDTNYYETFNRDNVTLVDIKHTPIEKVTARGLLVDGKEYKLDSLVFATGFDAMTGALANIDITGRNGTTLKQKWGDGPRTYLGITSAGFPNLFMITAPGSPSVLSNMIVAIEQHVDWTADCIQYLRDHNLDCMEASVDAEENWVEHVTEVGDSTLYPHANSWYVGANIPGKPRVFMPYAGGVGRYGKICSEVAAKGYEGFLLN